MMHRHLTAMVGSLSLTWVVVGVSTCAEPPGDPRLRSVEDLVEVGFSRSRVVMMNEAHSGLRRCVRTRQVGLRILFRAHAAGVRHLAMEALHRGFAEQANRTRRVPAWSHGYHGQRGHLDPPGTAQHQRRFR